MKALSTRNDDPQRASRPFDRDRDGFVVGEGSGMMVIERLDRALARKAPMIAEIVGYGMSGDAYHMASPAPDGEGAARCMQATLDNAGLGPDAIDYINAHGTSTPLNDLFETQAIKAVFGEHAYRLAISSHQIHDRPPAGRRRRHRDRVSPPWHWPVNRYRQPSTWTPPTRTAIWTTFPTPRAKCGFGRP
jgi:hypothetical protein